MYASTMSMPRVLPSTAIGVWPERSGTKRYAMISSVRNVHPGVLLAPPRGPPDRRRFARSSRRWRGYDSHMTTNKSAEERMARGEYAREGACAHHNAAHPTRAGRR